MCGLVDYVYASLACSLTAWSFFDAADSLLLCCALLVHLLARLVVLLDQLALLAVGCCLLLGDGSDLTVGGVNRIGKARKQASLFHVFLQADKLVVLELIVLLGFISLCLVREMWLSHFESPVY